MPHQHVSVRIVHLVNRHDDKPSAGHGHWLNHALKNSCISGGIDFVIAGSLHNQDAGVNKVLSLSKLQRIRLTYWPWFGLAKDFSTLVNLLQDTSRKETILHVYEGGLREFMLVSLIKAHQPNLRIIFNFNLVDPWHISILNGGGISRQIWKLMSKSDLKTSGGVLFTAETKELANLLSTRFDANFLEYPLPSLLPDSGNFARDREFNFFIPVFGDEELNLVTSALELFSRKKEVAGKVVVQPKWSSSLSDSSSNKILSLGIKLLPAVLSIDDYLSTIQSSQAIILPYKNVDYYQLQSSGRMIDAVASGAKVLVPEGTSLARKVLEKDWGLPFDVRSEKSLAEAMDKILTGYEPVDKKNLKLTPLDTFQILLANLPPEHNRYKNMGASKKSQPRFHLWLIGLLFVTTDFRSFISGMLDLVFFPKSLVKSLSNLFPRRTSP